MVAIKGFRGRFPLLSAPLLCLAAFIIGLPLPLPRWIFPVRTVVAYGQGRSARIAIAEAAGFVHAGSARIVVNRPPSADDFAAARGLYHERGIPVLFQDAGAGHPELPLASWSIDYDSLAASLPLTLLFAPWVESADSLEIRTGSTRLFYVSAIENGGQLLSLDRRLTVAIDAPEYGDAFIPVEIIVRDGAELARTAITVPAGGGLKPRILMVSDRPVQRSAVEALFPVRKIRLSELPSSDPFSYELIILDGLPLSTIGAANARILASVVERGAGSILVAADSPDFGKAGDAPPLERILPVDLAPRSLKNLPDLAMLILIDVSGSMFGNKLSLAKLGGIETLGNLKPSDLVGVMIFSEDSQWLYRFERTDDLEPSRDLAPLSAGGGTRMYPALREGLAELERAPMPVKHALIISDGVTEPADFG
ncbi:MAG: VWA domain-containing protein, partial [Spirochaetales bacterium]